MDKTGSFANQASQDHRHDRALTLAPTPPGRRYFEFPQTTISGTLLSAKGEGEAGGGNGAELSVAFAAG